MSVLSKVVNIMVFVEERQTDLANGEVASETKVVVLVVGCGEPVTQEKVFECFSWDLRHIDRLID